MRQAISRLDQQDLDKEKLKWLYQKIDLKEIKLKLHQLRLEKINYKSNPVYREFKDKIHQLIIQENKLVKDKEKLECKMLGLELVDYDKLLKEALGKKCTVNVDKN